MNTNLIHASKRFLNLDGFESDASIFTELKFRSDEGIYVETTLKIRDCTDQISLTIYVSGEDAVSGHFQNSIFKIDTLIRELTNFKEACFKAHEESKRRGETREAERKKQQDEMDSRNSDNSVMHHISDPASTPPVGSGDLREEISNPRNI